MSQGSAPARIAAIILAAGGSTRLGYSKQLLKFDGEALVRRAARSALEAGANPVTVVIGAQAEKVESALRGLEVTTCVNDRWKSGLASSIIAAISVVSENQSWDGVLIMLTDQPFVDCGVLKKLIQAFDGTHRVVAAQYESAVGVPAIFGREFVDELLKLEGDSGAGWWLRARVDKVTSIPLGARGLDIDTPNDVDQLLAGSPGDI